MLLETENKFKEKIDCKFPYDNREECKRLIREAASISEGAMFFVIEEICRIPKSKRKNVSDELLFELINEVKALFNHPLKTMIADVAVKIIKAEELTVKEVKTKMEEVRKYPDQYGALSILYFSCDDKDEELESIWDSIIKEWK